MVQSLMRDLDDRIYDVELDPVKVGRSQKKGETSGLVPTGAHNSVDLSVGVEEAGEGLEKLRLQSWSLRITRWKLMMDLIFVCELSIFLSCLLEYSWAPYFRNRTG